MNPVRSIDVPEQGQVVEVRQLRFATVAITQCTLPASLYSNSIERAQHLVTLTPVGDDALGEELEVIWELEAGARIIDDVNLSEITGFDPPERLDAFLDAVRWGGAASNCR